MPRPLLLQSRKTFHLASVAIACLGLSAQPTWSQPGQNPPGASVSRGSLKGVLVSAVRCDLSSKAAGVIEKFFADEGQRVSAGDKLVQLNADIERADLTKAQAALAAANVDFDRTKADLDRIQPLFQKDKIGSQKEFEDAGFIHQGAIARQNIAKADVEMAEARLNERAIYAPISGLVLRRTRQIGEAVERLEPVVQLVDPSKLELLVYAGADLLGKFKEGQSARILMEDGPARGTATTATVSFVDPIMDSTGTFRIKLAVEPTDKVTSGMAVSLQLPSEVN
jgi:membrane fusion protein (multidrug efflux system)